MKYLKIIGSALLCLLIICGSLWKIAKLRDFQFFGELLNHAQTQEKIVALTFDDGPSPKNTQDLLAILKEFDIHATFFLIGQNIEKYPELAEEVVKAGHQLANHTHSHTRTLLGSVDFFRHEITSTDVLIRKVGYLDDIVFRPPFGKKLFTLPWDLKDLNKLSVTWDAESRARSSFFTMDLRLSRGQSWPFEA